MRRTAMCVIPRTWLRLFLYSAFTLVGLLGLWVFTFNQDISKDIGKFDALFLPVAKRHGEMNRMKTNGDLEHTLRAQMAVQKIRENKANVKIRASHRNKRHKRVTRYVKSPKKSHSIGDRGIEIASRHQNARTEKSRTFSKVATKKSNTDTTKQRLYFPSQGAKVYGEPGCPDNPWRKGLSELVQMWTNISKQHNIEYVLAFGSLLGAMRNYDVIPYDSDIDILIDINYFPIMKRLSSERNINNADDKILLVLQPEFTLNIPVESRRRFDCQGKETPHLVDECSFQEPMARLFKGDLHIDFYHFYERVHYVDDPSEDRLKQYHKKDFYPFRPCSFMGLEASCPNKPWEILRIYFNTDNFEPIYKCKNRTWVDKDGLAANVY